MTGKELEQLKYLTKEIEMDKRRLLELTQGERRTDIPAIIEDKLRRCEAERERLEQYIAGIDDTFTRQIFINRYAAGLSWDEVARLAGPGNNSGNVRMWALRYMAKNSD